MVHRLGDLQVRSAPASEFNGKLMVWFHPHRGGKTAQRWLRNRLLKSFPRTDFFMPSFLKKIDKRIALEIATELHLLVATIYESAKLSSRPYDEVVLVGYGEGVLIMRKVEEFGNGYLQSHLNPEAAILARDSWNEIRENSRTILIARGEASSALPSLTDGVSKDRNWWGRFTNRVIQMVTH